MQFPFFGTCAWGSVTHWSARADRYFEASHLMGLFVFGRGVGGVVIVGPSTLFGFPWFKLVTRTYHYVWYKETDDEGFSVTVTAA